MFKKLRFRLVITAAGVACMVVAVAFAGACAFSALKAAVGPIYASGLTAVIFLMLAVGLLAFLHFEEEEEKQEALSKGSKWAGIAGEVAGAFLAGFIQRSRAR
jgi:hypothetical protein